MKSVLRNVDISGGDDVVYSAAGSETDIIDSTISGNVYGLYADSSSTMRVQHSQIVNNAQGLFTSGGGQLLSHLDNTVLDNDVNGAFTGNFAST